MKKLTLLTALALGLFVSSSFGAEDHASLSSPQMVWVGLDFSHTKLVGPGQFNNANAPFPEMFDTWNNLFLHERISAIERETKKAVSIDIASVTDANKEAPKANIIESPGPDDTIHSTDLTPEKIAKMVRGYDLKEKSGLGVVFIVDRFVKFAGKPEGAVYVVAFDIGSRDVLFSRREVSPAAGIGFRNYWFRVIKNSERTLKKLH